MRLYHSTNTDFPEIGLAKSFPLKGFGQGFCLTTVREQAERMAKRKQQALGSKAIVQEYEFEENALHKGDLRVLIFEGATPEWATFIFNNRSRNKNYQHDYDIVVGPVADGGVVFLINLHTTGAITLTQFARILKFKKLGDQYFFRTKKAVKLLGRIK